MREKGQIRKKKEKGVVEEKEKRRRREGEGEKERVQKLLREECLRAMRFPGRIVVEVEANLQHGSRQTLLHIGILRAESINTNEEK